MLPASRPMWDAQMETEPPASKGAGGACSGYGDEPPAGPGEVWVRAPGHYFQSCRLYLVPALGPGINDFSSGPANRLATVHIERCARNQSKRGYLQTTVGSGMRWAAITTVLEDGDLLSEARLPSSE